MKNFVCCSCRLWAPDIRHTCSNNTYRDMCTQWRNQNLFSAVLQGSRQGRYAIWDRYRTITDKNISRKARGCALYDLLKNCFIFCFQNRRFEWIKKKKKKNVQTTKSIRIFFKHSIKMYFFFFTLMNIKSSVRVYNSCKFVKDRMNDKVWIATHFAEFV